MNYTKPQVNTLGDATAVIQRPNGQKPPFQVFETGKVLQDPAYDLDE